VEETPFRPVSPYAFSKAVADEIAAACAAHDGLDIVRTRSFSHTGAGQTPGFVLPSWAQQIARFERSGRGAALRVGNLEVTRDILDVRDVAECYARLLERGRCGEAYNVCRGEGIRLRDVAGLMVRLSRVPVDIEVDPERVRPADVAYLVGDPSKTAEVTGWAPTRTIPEMLEGLLASWRERAEIGPN
jgi:GDP-4-dehydro-6-deoxy-D-mannose reductase